MRVLGSRLTLVVILVIAACVGYQGAMSIHANAREMARGHCVGSGRVAEREGQLEQQSPQLRDELGEALTGLRGILRRMDGPDVFERRAGEMRRPPPPVILY